MSVAAIRRANHHATSQLGEEVQNSGLTVLLPCRCALLALVARLELAVNPARRGWALS